MTAFQILQNFQLRRTPCRTEVLECFLQNAQQALSEAHLYEHCQGKFDKVTIYRTLNTFQEKGIIHRVVHNSNNALRYALSVNKENEYHNEPHAHFKCVTCEETYCLMSVDVSNVILPKGYQSLQNDFLVTGICDKCNK